MAESDKKLDEQLDALAREAMAEKDVPRADGRIKEDVIGEEFADQVQKMLDEAKSELHAGEPGDAPVKPAVSEQELIGQIDKMLAQQADDALEGRFESVDELLAEDQAADHAAQAAKAELAKATNGQEPAISAKANAVGQEMDADDSHMQSIEEMFPDEDDPSSILEGSMAGHEDSVVVAETGGSGGAVKHRQETRSVMVRALMAVNRPLEGLSPTWRNAVGLWGVANLLGVTVLFSFLWGGLLGATMAVLATSAAAVVLVRKLFLC